MTHSEIVTLLKTCGTAGAVDAMFMLDIKGGLMPNLHSVQPHKKFAGKAFTSKFAYVDKADANKWYYEDAMDPNSPYCSGYDAIDACPKGDILISGGADDKGIGGLLAYRTALNKGLEAYIFDGRTRDYDEISQYEMPLFCTGRSLIMAPPNLKEVAINEPVVCDGVLVKTGDYLVGDGDGVVRIEQSKINEVAEMINKIMQIENQAMRALDEKASPMEIEKISASRAKLIKKGKENE